MTDNKAQKGIVLNYVWIDRFNGLNNVGFNLGGKYRYKIEKKENGRYELSRTNKNVNFHSFIEGKVIELEQVTKNYLNSDITPFLICEYRNKTYDWYLNLARPHVPVFIIHFFVYLSRRSYYYKFPLDDYKKIFS